MTDVIRFDASLSDTPTCPSRSTQLDMAGAIGSSCCNVDWTFLPISAGVSVSSAHFVEMPKLG